MDSKGRAAVVTTKLTRSLEDSSEEEAVERRLERLFEEVPSPTFTLVQTYDTQIGEIWHADLYRLTSHQEAVELGLEEAFETSISLIEWPDRLGDLSRYGPLNIAFSSGASEGDRHLKLQGSASIWAPRLQGLSDE